MKKDFTSSIEETDSLHIMVRQFSRLVVEKVKQDIEKQIDDIIRTGHTFSDLESRKQELRARIGRLETERDEKLSEYRVAKKELDSLSGKINKMTTSLERGLVLSEKELEIAREAVSRLEVIRPLCDEMWKDLNSYGRLGRAHVNLYLKTLTNELKKLESATPRAVLHMMENKERLLSVFDEELVHGVHKNIVASIVGHTGGLAFLSTLGSGETCSYIEKVVSSMRAEDFVVRPFEYLDEDTDMDGFAPDYLYRDICRTVGLTVLKFVEPCRQELFRKTELFRSFSELEDSYVEKVI